MACWSILHYDSARTGARGGDFPMTYWLIGITAALTLIAAPAPRAPAQQIVASIQAP